MQFLAKYGKMYASKSDMSSRFQIFAENFDRIQAHNSAPEGRFKMGINQFADLSVEEFTSLYGTTGLKVRATKPRKL